MGISLGVAPRHPGDAPDWTVHTTGALSPSLVFGTLYRSMQLHATFTASPAFRVYYTGAMQFLRVVVDDALGFALEITTGRDGSFWLGNARIEPGVPQPLAIEATCNTDGQHDGSLLVTLNDVEAIRQEECLFTHEPLGRWSGATLELLWGNDGEPVPDDVTITLDDLMVAGHI